MELDTQKYTFETGTHNDKNVIWILFPYNQNLISELKKQTSVRWSTTNKNGMYRIIRITETFLEWNKITMERRLYLI